MFKNIGVIVMAASTLMLAACGGSGGTEGGSGESANNMNRGVITGFGSVYINGVRYHTDNATVRSDDSVLSDVRELKVGMVASVVSDDNNKASSVSFDEDVKGPVDAEISDFSSPVSVMGQTVIVDAATIVDNSLSLPLAAGEVLEVSGLRQPDASILATYVEDKALADVNKFKVIGQAVSVDTSARTFVIGGLTVDYNSADVSDLSGGHPAEGQLVEVKDEAKTYVAGSATLSATKVEGFSLTGDDDSSDDSSIDNFEIETVVSEVVTAGEQFKIPNFTVNILPETTFRYGTALDLGPGSVVQIKARINTDDELDAIRISFKRNAVRLTAAVDPLGVDTGNNTVTVLGVTIKLAENARIEDDRDGLEPFTIADISDGDYLEIRGFIGAESDTLIATRLEREDFRDRVELRSVATNVDTVGQSLVLLGITVTPGPSTQFSGAANAEAFFDRINEGQSIVKVKWDPFVDTSMAPKEMELQDDFSNNESSGSDDSSSGSDDSSDSTDDSDSSSSSSSR